MKIKINYFAILTFYVIAVALRYLTNKTDLLNGVSNEFIKVLLQGIGPAVGALIVFSIFKIKPALTLKGNYLKALTPFLLYWILPLVFILGSEYSINGTLNSVATVITIIIYGLLEEMGWRGFLQKELKPLPEFVNVFIVATLWFIWHLNFELKDSNLLFFGILLLGSWGIGKIADNTQSLIAVSAFHSLNNFFPSLNTPKMILLAILLSVWISSLIIRKRQLKKSIL